MSVAAWSAPAGADGGCYAAARSAAGAYNVAPEILYSIVYVESGGHPWILNVDGETVLARSAVEAERYARQMIEAGRNVDIGCMQISWKWHGRYFDDVGQLFDAAANVRYGARHLATLAGAGASWSVAVGRYHSWKGPRQVEYRCRVASVLASYLGQRLSACD